MKEHKENLSIQIKTQRVPSLSFFLSVSTLFKFVFLGFLVFFGCIQLFVLAASIFQYKMLSPLSFHLGNLPTV